VRDTARASAEPVARMDLRVKVCLIIKFSFE
jgi:hypothetical protein